MAKRQFKPGEVPAAMKDTSWMMPLTAEQIGWFFAYAVKSEAIMRLAIALIDDSDFDIDYRTEKVIWQVCRGIYQRSHRLPSLQAMLTECDAMPIVTTNSENDPSAHSRARDCINWMFTVNSLDESHAKQILRRFVFHRRYLPLFHYIHCSKWIADTTWLSFKDAEAAVFFSDSNVDLGRISMANILTNKDTFRPATFVSTGHPSVDRLLGGGLALGEATALGGASGMGKSTFMTNLAVNVVTNKTPCLIISLEMKTADITKLALAIMGRIPRLHIRSWRLTTEENDRFLSAHAKLLSLPLNIIDRHDFSGSVGHALPDTEAVEAAIRATVTNLGVKVIIIDYLAKISSPETDELRRMARLNDWVFSLAQETNTHIVSIAQQNKASYKSSSKKERTSGLEDIRGGIENVADPDNVVALIRPDWNVEGAATDPGEMKVVVNKSRQGIGGSCKLVFHKSTGFIEEHKDEPAPKTEAAPPKPVSRPVDM